MNWYLDVLKQYAVFGGRARRKEYWMFILFNLIISLVLGTVEGALFNTTILSLLYSLAVLLPSIAVTVRRLHDTGRSGWWFLIAFIPLIGAIVLLIFMVLEGQPETNEYGVSPKANSIQSGA